MFNFNVKLIGNINVTVVANNKEEARRILSDTIESITVKDIREKLTNRSEVEIESSNLTTQVSEKPKEKGDER